MFGQAFAKINAVTHECRIGYGIQIRGERIFLRSYQPGDINSLGEEETRDFQDDYLIQLAHT